MPDPTATLDPPPATATPPAATPTPYPTPDPSNFDPVLQARYSQYVADGTLTRDPAKAQMAQQMLARGVVNPPAVAPANPAPVPTPNPSAPAPTAASSFDPVLQQRFQNYLADGTLTKNPDKAAMAQRMLGAGVIKPIVSQWQPGQVPTVNDQAQWLDDGSALYDPNKFAALNNALASGALPPVTRAMRTTNPGDLSVDNSIAGIADPKNPAQTIATLVPWNDGNQHGVRIQFPNAAAQARYNEVVQSYGYDPARFGGPAIPQGAPGSTLMNLYGTGPVPDMAAMLNQGRAAEDQGSGAGLAGTPSMGQEYGADPNAPRFGNGRLPVLEQAASDVVTHGVPNILPATAAAVAAPFGAAVGSLAGPVGGFAGGMAAGAGVYTATRAAQDWLAQKIDPKDFAQFQREDAAIQKNDPNAAFAADLAANTPFQGVSGEFNAASMGGRALGAGIQVGQKGIEDAQQGKFDPGGLALRGAAGFLTAGEPTAFGEHINSLTEGPAGALGTGLKSLGQSALDKVNLTLAGNDPIAQIQVKKNIALRTGAYDFATDENGDPVMVPAPKGTFGGHGAPPSERDNTRAPAYVPYDTAAPAPVAPPAAPTAQSGEVPINLTIQPPSPAAPTHTQPLQTAPPSATITPAGQNPTQPRVGDPTQPRVGATPVLSAPNPAQPNVPSAEGVPANANPTITQRRDTTTASVSPGVGPAVGQVPPAVTGGGGAQSSATGNTGVSAGLPRTENGTVSGAGARVQQSEIAVPNNGGTGSLPESRNNAVAPRQDLTNPENLSPKAQDYATALHTAQSGRITPAQAEMQAIYANAFAQRWAYYTGGDPDEWWDSRIAMIRNGLAPEVDNEIRTGKAGPNAPPTATGTAPVPVDTAVPAAAQTTGQPDSTTPQPDSTTGQFPSPSELQSMRYSEVSQRPEVQAAIQRIAAHEAYPRLAVIMDRVNKGLANRGAQTLSTAPGIVFDHDYSHDDIPAGLKTTAANLQKRIAKGAGVERNNADGMPFPWNVVEQARRSQPGASVEKGQDSLFQSPAGHAPSLVALHNTNANGILAADRLGGIPAPSIAIQHPGDPFSGFGDVTLVGNRKMVDPEADARNKAYTSDVYSPRQPRPSYDLDLNGSRALNAAMNANGAHREFTGHNFDLGSYSIRKEDAVNELAGSMAYQDGVKATYLREKGIAPTPATKTEPLRWLILDSPSMRKFAKDNPRIMQEAEEGRDNGDDSAALKLGSAIKASAREVLAREGERNPTADDIRDVTKHLMIDDNLGNPVNWQTVKDLEKLRSPKTVPDDAKNRENIAAAMQGHEADFHQWVQNHAESAFKNRYLDRGGRKETYTLDNLVDAMTGRVKAQEKNLTSGLGNARAAGAKPLKSIGAMHDAEGNLISESDFEAHKEASNARLSQLQTDLIDNNAGASFGSTLDKLDNVGKAIAAYSKSMPAKPNEARMRNILARYGFPTSEFAGFTTPSQEVVHDATMLAHDLQKMPTEYFESKPQRAVKLSEFSGAVVPEGTPKAVLDALAKHGVEVRTYKSGDNEGRSAAVQSLANPESGSLFQSKQRTGRGKPKPGEPDKYRAQVIFLKDGRAIIEALHNPDFSSGFHEFNHVARRDLYRDFNAPSRNGSPGGNGFTMADWEHVEEWCGVKNKQAWRDGTSDPDNKDAEEKFANGYQKYIYTDEAPTPGLRRVFAAFKAWMLKAFKGIPFPEIELSPQMRDIYARLLGRDIPRPSETATAEATAAPPGESAPSATQETQPAPGETSPTDSAPGPKRTPRAEGEDFAGSTNLKHIDADEERKQKYRDDAEAAGYNAKTGTSDEEIMRAAKAMNLTVNQLRGIKLGESIAVTTHPNPIAHQAIRTLATRMLANEQERLSVVARQAYADAKTPAAKAKMLTALAKQESDTALALQHADAMSSSSGRTLAQQKIDATAYQGPQAGTSADKVISPQKDTPAPARGSQNYGKRNKFTTDRAALIAEIANMPTPTGAVPDDVFGEGALHQEEPEEGGNALHQPAAERQDQTDTPEFKRWFGDSKVVDENGKPIRVYHGSGREYGTFDKNALFGSVSPQLANEYAEAHGHMGEKHVNVLPIYMKVDHPFDADNVPNTTSVGAFFNEALNQAKKDGRNVNLPLANELLNQIRAGASKEESGPNYSRHDIWYDPKSFFGTEGALAAKRLFKELGFDGIKHTENGHLTYGAFEPTQIKSAIGNRGTFDPEDANILHQPPAPQPYHEALTKLGAFHLEAGTRTYKPWAAAMQADLKTAGKPAASEGDMQIVYRNAKNYLSQQYKAAGGSGTKEEHFIDQVRALAGGSNEGAANFVNRVAAMQDGPDLLAKYAAGGSAAVTPEQETAIVRALQASVKDVMADRKANPTTNTHVQSYIDLQAASAKLRKAEANAPAAVAARRAARVAADKSLPGDTLEDRYIASIAPSMGGVRSGRAQAFRAAIGEPLLTKLVNGEPMTPAEMKKIADAKIANTPSRPGRQTQAQENRDAFINGRPAAVIPANELDAARTTMRGMGTDARKAAKDAELKTLAGAKLVRADLLKIAPIDRKTGLISEPWIKRLTADMATAGDDPRKLANLHSRYMATWGKNAQAYAVNNLISGTSTAEKVLISNLMTPITDEASRAFAAPVSKGTVQPPNLRSMGHAYGKAITQGLPEAADLMRYGESGLTLAGNNKFSQPGQGLHGEFSLPDKAGGKVLNPLFRAVPRLHAAMGHVSSVYGYERGMADAAMAEAGRQADAAGLKGTARAAYIRQRSADLREQPTDEMKAYASDYGTQIANRQPNRVSEETDRFAGRFGREGKGIKTALAPILKVPLNLALRQGQHTFGPLTMAHQGARLASEDYNNWSHNRFRPEDEQQPPGTPMSEEQRRSAAMAFGRGALGTLGLAAGILGHRSGAIQAPDDSKHKEGSVFGYSNNWMYPLSGPVMAGATLDQMGWGNPDAYEQIGKSYIRDNPLISAGGALAAAFAPSTPEGEREYYRVLGSLLAEGIPFESAVREAAASFDPTGRIRTKKSVPDFVKNDVPGPSGRYGLPVSKYPETRGLFSAVRKVEP
jgi:Barnase-EndoU-ColicinE5/D-RelE like nuclease/ADP-ribosyltransferase-like protein